MESNITTMKSEKFGTVRRICEKNKVLYCASDIAKSLGYSNAHDAVVRHCRASVKRATPISGKIQDINFIPEADVYRLICHSKLPSALEFEKWVFEDVVPKAVDDKLNAEPEQLTLETSEYHYFHKTFKGEPVITVADFAYFSGINADSARCFVKRYCKLGKEYYLLEREALAAFKLENPEMGRMCSALIVLTKSSVDKLVKYYNCVTEIPMIEEKKPVALPASRREYVLKREPSKEMKSLIEHLHNEIKAIEGISYMLLCPDTKDNHENQREQLVKRIRALRDYSFDVSTILIE